MTASKPDGTSAAAFVSGLDALEPATAQPLEMEVRSGIDFLFRDPLKRGVPAETQEEIGQNVKEGVLLDRFVSEWGFDVAYEHAEEFHAWLAANEKYLARYCPPTARYRGTYAVMSGEKRHAGRYRTIWSFNSFNGMQDFAEEVGDETSALRRLLDQFNAFRSRGESAAESEWMMIPAAGSHRF